LIHQSYLINYFKKKKRMKELKNEGIKKLKEWEVFV